MSKKKTTNDEPIEEAPVPDIIEEPVDAPPVEDAPKPEDQLVDIGALQAEKFKPSPIDFVDNDQRVYAWYQSLQAGQRFTREEAAQLLDISVEELNNSLIRLQARILPKELGHFID
jgi:hypothetical protein